MTCDDALIVVSECIASIISLKTSEARGFKFCTQLRLSPSHKTDV